MQLPAEGIVLQSICIGTSAKKKVLDNYKEEALEDFIEAADLRPLEDILCNW